MQNETSLYDISSSELLNPFEGKRVGEGRELGEAKIVNTFWGNARVRIVRQEEISGGFWLMAAIVALGIIAVIAYLLMQATPTESETSDNAAQPVQPVPQTMPEPKLATPQTPAPLSRAPAAQITNPDQTAVQHPVIRQGEQTRPVTRPPANRKSTAGKTETSPAVAAEHQAVHTQVTDQPAKSPVVVPLSIKPATTEPLLQITKTPPAQPAPEAGAVTVQSAGKNQQPGPAETQPQGVSQ